MTTIQDVPAHVLPSTRYVDETLARYLADKDDMAAKIDRNPNVSGVLLDRFIEAAVLAELVGKPRDVAVSCLNAALDAGMAAFRLAAGTGPVTVSIAGRDHVLAATGATDLIHPATWQHLFGLALALRRKDAADAICAFDVDVMRTSEARVDDFRYDVVTAMQQFWCGGNWRAAAERVYETSQPKFTRVAGRDYVDVDVTQVKMLEPLDARDDAAFDAALAASLEAHKLYWSGKQWSGRIIGLIAMTPVGLAALAHDRGLATGVRSGYIPDWLVRGELGS